MTLFSCLLFDFQAGLTQIGFEAFYYTNESLYRYILKKQSLAWREIRYVTSFFPAFTILLDNFLEA